MKCSSTDGAKNSGAYYSSNAKSCKIANIQIFLKLHAITKIIGMTQNVRDGFFAKIFVL